MDQKVRILILEDNPFDNELILHKLTQSGFTYESQTAQNKNAFLKLLEQFVPDIMLADYSLPGFDGLAAMELARQKYENLPVIILSGVIGEERAIETMKAGATDYVLKQNLSRLGPVIRRALREAQEVKNRKRAEEEEQARAAELELTTKRLTSVLNCIVEGVVTLSPSGFLELNPAGFALAGFEQAEGAVHIDDFESAIQLFDMDGNPIGSQDWPLHRAMRGESIKNLDVRLVNIRNGGERFLTCNAVPVRDAKGDISLIVMTVHDISERKENEALLKQAKDLAEKKARELADTNQELESFAYSVSHDLRGPLSTVKGFSDIIMEDYAGRLDESGRTYLRRIDRGINRMNVLIEGMLKLFKISRQELEIKDVDLSRLASSIIEVLRRAEPQRMVDVVIHADLCVRGDAKLIDIALTNLFNNAWKFTAFREQGQIEFGAIENGGEWVYFVRDNGAGFDMSQSEKLFAPFQRLHTEKEFEGTGVGLPIVERVVKRHGGRIWAEAEPGVGAVFYFTIPAGSDCSLAEETFEAPVQVAQSSS